MAKQKKKRGRPRKNPLQSLPALLPELTPAPAPEQPEARATESASPGTTGASPVSESDQAAQAEFAAASEKILDDAGALHAAAEPESEPAIGAVTTSVTIPNIGVIEISQDGVRRYIDAPFDGLASQLDNAKYKLEPFERDLLVPGVTGCLNRYLPDFLKNTNHPELAVLLVALSIYGVRIGAGAIIEKILAKFSSAPDTQTAESVASTRSSDSPASARPTPQRGFVIPSPGASGSTP